MTPHLPHSTPQTLHPGRRSCCCSAERWLGRGMHHARSATAIVSAASAALPCRICFKYQIRSVPPLTAVWVEHRVCAAQHRVQHPRANACLAPRAATPTYHLMYAWCRCIIADLGPCGLVDTRGSLCVHPVMQERLWQRRRPLALPRWLCDSGRPPPLRWDKSIFVSVFIIFLMSGSHNHHLFGGHLDASTTHRHMFWAVRLRHGPVFAFSPRL